MPSRAEYLRQWSALHGGAGTGGLVGSWLGLVHTLAGPPVRLGVGPDAVTLLGLLVALGAVPAAAAGGRWPVLASLLVLVSGLLDNLDGAVAVMAGRTSRRGFVLDSVCDRIADAGYGVALWLAGAPGPLAVAATGSAWLQEYVRARAAVAGMPQIGVVTVAERPTRVIVTGMFLLGCGLHPGAGTAWATAGALAWAATGLIGLAQLSRAVTHGLS